MALAEIVDGEIHLTCTFRENSFVAGIPGARYKRDVWKLPLSWGSCQAMRGVLGDDLQLGEALVGWANEHKHAIEARHKPSDRVDKILIDFDV